MILRRAARPVWKLPYHMNLIRLSLASDPVVAKATRALGIGARAASLSASSSTTGTVRWAPEGYIGRARIWRVAASISSSSE